MTAEKRRAILRKTGDSDVQDLLDLIEELEARLALAERLAEAVEAYVRVADGHVPGEPVEDLLMESMRRFDAIQPALSAFRESEKKG